MPTESPTTSSAANSATDFKSGKIQLRNIGIYRLPAAEIGDAEEDLGDRLAQSQWGDSIFFTRGQSLIKENLSIEKAQTVMDMCVLTNIPNSSPPTVQPKTSMRLAGLRAKEQLFEKKRLEKSEKRKGERKIRKEYRKERRRRTEEERRKRGEI